MNPLVTGPREPWWRRLVRLLRRRHSPDASAGWVDDIGPDDLAG